MPNPRNALSALCIGLLAAACASNTTGHSGAAPPAAPSAPESPAPQVEVPAIERPGGETPEWWYRLGAAQAAARGAMAGGARNVILFVGDGMSLTTVAAARILEGQRLGQPGEEHRLAWEDFPATALVRTYNTDSQTPDSAGTMTAMASGVKTRAGMIGVGQAAARGDCNAALATPLATLWELATGAGMAIGVVTTTRLTHATPAATLARVPDRDWENDTQLPPAAAAAGCTDIARQMIDSAAAPAVMLGGGRRNFMTAAQPDPEYPLRTGRRRDGRDLVAAWQRRHPQGEYVWNAQQLAAAPADTPLLGLFEPDHMRYEHDRPQDVAGEPSLAEMTRAAISRLSR
ncbi:MAG: alkaline phosphatase, partial [Pseudomonadota bacterium]|nr:alkaline phosphatase [Pseudomonadota bacterium]